MKGARRATHDWFHHLDTVKDLKMSKFLRFLRKVDTFMKFIALVAGAIDLFVLLLQVAIEHDQMVAMKK